MKKKCEQQGKKKRTGLTTDEKFASSMSGV